jgi:hypothetical protein
MRSRFGCATLNLSWSDTHRRLFFLPDTVSTYRLDRLTYAVQQNGTTLSTGTVPISPQQYAVSLQFDVSTVGLAPGFYDLCVTAIDEANREVWRLVGYFRSAEAPPLSIPCQQAA